MKTYTYKDIEITFNEGSAKFTATIEGKFASTPSLDAMQKKIDKVRAHSFKAFEAFEFPNAYRYPDTVTPIQVTGIAKDARRGYSNYGFSFKNPQGYDTSTTVLVPGTPEGKAAIEAYIAVAKEKREIEEKMQAKLNEAQKQIPTLHVGPYMKEHNLV